MNAIFIGCIDFSKTLLKILIESEGMVIKGIVTKKKSSLNSDFLDLSEIGNKYNIPIFYYEGKKSDDNLVLWVKKISPQINFCFGWSHLLPTELIQIPPLGTIGYHPAELPMNRGRHPVIWALALGLKQTASTFFMIDESADSGDIVSQELVAINDTDDAKTLYEKLESVAADQIKKIAAELRKNKLPRTPQKHGLANSWRKRNERDGIIDWRMSTDAIYNLIRALSKPYPGASFIHNEKKILVWKSQKIENRKKNIEPGTILNSNDQSFVVKTYDGSLQITSFEGDFKPIVGDYL